MTRMRAAIAAALRFLQMARTTTAIRKVSDLSHPYSPITPVPSCKFGVAGGVIVVDDLATHELVTYPIPAAGGPLVEAGRFPATGDPAMVVSSTGDRVYLSEGDMVHISDLARPHAIRLSQMLAWPRCGSSTTAVE